MEQLSLTEAHSKVPTFLAGGTRRFQLHSGDKEAFSPRRGWKGAKSSPIIWQAGGNLTVNSCQLCSLAEF